MQIRIQNGGNKYPTILKTNSDHLTPPSVMTQARFLNLSYIILNRDNFTIDVYCFYTVLFKKVQVSERSQVVSASSNRDFFCKRHLFVEYSPSSQYFTSDLFDRLVSKFAMSGEMY